MKFENSFDKGILKVECQDRKRAHTKDGEAYPFGYTYSWTGTFDLNDPSVREAVSTALASQINIRGASKPMFDGWASTDRPNAEEKDHFDGNVLTIDVNEFIDAFTGDSESKVLTPEQQASKDAYSDIKRWLKSNKDISMSVGDIKKNVNAEKKGWKELYSKFFDANLAKLNDNKAEIEL